MFSPEILTLIPQWKVKKQAQWDRIKDSLHGLQLATSGEQGTQFTLVCSPHDESFYEGVVFGQLPQIALKPYGSRLNPRFKDMKDEEKPLEKRAIDLTNEQIDAILAKWASKESAISLPFVLAVIGPDGKMRVRT